MLNALVWALACFGVVAADIVLSMVLFSVLDIVSALTGFPIDNLDIQWFQAVAQTASFLMALLWWRYLWPRSFIARWQGERPLGGGVRSAWKRIACVIVIGLALQVVVGYVTDAVLSLLPEVAADYSELVEETGMGDTSYLAVLTTVLGAPFCEELLVRGAMQAVLSRWGTWFSIVVSSVVFTLLHGDIAQMPSLFILSVLMGLAAYCTGSLALGMALHFAYNTMSFLFLYAAQKMDGVSAFAFAGYLVAVFCVGAVVCLAAIRRLGVMRRFRPIPRVYDPKNRQSRLERLASAPLFPLVMACMALRATWPLFAK